MSKRPIGLGLESMDWRTMKDRRVGEHGGYRWCNYNYIEATFLNIRRETKMKIGKSCYTDPLWRPNGDPESRSTDISIIPREIANM